MRGHNLGPVPRKARRHFRRGKLRAAIYAALRGGPLTGREIVERVAAAHGLAYRAMYRSVYAQLGQMTKAGAGGAQGREWQPFLDGRLQASEFTAYPSAPARSGQ